METVGFAIVGAGMIAHHCGEEINAHENGKIVAATDINETRLKALQASLKIPSIYSQAEEMFADPAVDAVYIAVPNKFHAPLSIQALEAGKHVILDKPFALNFEEAAAVAAAAKRSGKLFTLGMNFRFMPGAQNIRSQVAAGKLGDIYHIKSFIYRRAGIPKFGTWFSQKEMSGGGVMLDVGVHILDVALYIIDNFEPVSVSGKTYREFGHRGIGEGGWGMSDAGDHKFDVEDFATALIRMKNGMTVDLDVSWAIHRKDEGSMDVQLFGSEGGATVFPAEIFKYGPGEGEYQIVQNPKGELRHPHKNRFHNFINAILGTEELCVTIDQALAVQKILDGIYKSSEEGMEVRFS